MIFISAFFHDDWKAIWMRTADSMIVAALVNLKLCLPEKTPNGIINHNNNRRYLPLRSF
jgi:hypothetical protein